MTNYAVNQVVNFIYSLTKPTVGPELDKDIKRAVKNIKRNIKKTENIEYLRSTLKEKLMNINYVGMPLFPKFNPDLVMEALRFNYKENDYYAIDKGL